MKLLMLDYEFPPLGGGTGIANQYLLKEFKKRQELEIDLVTSSTEEYKEERLGRNINIFYLNVGKRGKNLHHQTGLNLINYLIKSSWWVMRHKDEYDLIQAFSGLPGGVTAWLSGKPYLISFRGGEEPGYEKRYDFWLKLAKPLLALVYSRAKSLDANSRYLKELILKSFPGLKIKLINNGVDKNKFHPAKRLSGQPVILCTSRLAPRKGVEFLVRAMPLILAQIPKAKLKLIGQGQLALSLKQLVKKRRLAGSVEFVDIISHDRLASIYRQASLFVLPSLSESLSNSLLEAMACGLPIVATNVGGNPELVSKKNGILVPVGNSRALAKAIIKVLKNKQLRIKMSQTSRRMAEQYSWSKTAQKYFQLYS